MRSLQFYLPKKPLKCHPKCNLSEYIHNILARTRPFLARSSTVLQMHFPLRRCELIFLAQHPWSGLFPMFDRSLNRRRFSVCTNWTSRSTASFPYFLRHSKFCGKGLQPSDSLPGRRSRPRQRRPSGRSPGSARLRPDALETTPAPIDVPRTPASNSRPAKRPVPSSPPATAALLVSRRPVDPHPQVRGGPISKPIGPGESPRASPASAAPERLRTGRELQNSTAAPAP